MAFGTGLHPTTRLCLAGDRIGGGPRPGAGARRARCRLRLGNLAIAAARLGAGAVVGVDTDPIAVEATLANARRNGLAADPARGSLPSGEGPFDFVAADLIARVLIALAAALHAELRPGGRLLASGIFVDREAERIRAAFDAAGLAVTERTAEGDWVALGGNPAGLTGHYNRAACHGVTIPVPPGHPHRARGEPLPAVTIRCPLALRTRRAADGRARTASSASCSGCRPTARS